MKETEFLKYRDALSWRTRLATILLMGSLGMGSAFAESNVGAALPVDVHTLAGTPSVQQSVKKISGVITDQNGEPIIGVNVVVKGTTNGTITGLDGDFVLEVPEKSTLVISYIGYVQKEIAINSNSTYNIKLMEDTQKLDVCRSIIVPSCQRHQSLS